MIIQRAHVEYVFRYRFMFVPSVHVNVVVIAQVPSRPRLVIGAKARIDALNATQSAAIQ
jgi:hypothetical protein